MIPHSNYKAQLLSTGLNSIVLIVADLTGILPQYVIDFVFEHFEHFEHFNLIVLFVANSLVSIVQHIEEKEINMIKSLCSPEKYN